MFVSLSTARYLSVYAIEWLHFNGWRGTDGWRECYKSCLEKRKSDPSAVYYPAPNIYHRLTALRAGPDPLVHRVARSVERASVVYNRLPDAYTLTGAGASLLCTRRGYELDDLRYEDPRRRSIKNFEHSSGMRRLLDFYDDFEVVGEAGSTEDAFNLVADTNPDVILLDIDMPGVGGVAATDTIRSLYPNCRVLLLTSYQRYAVAGIQAGASGYILKDADEAIMIDAIRAIAAGGVY